MNLKCSKKISIRKVQIIGDSKGLSSCIQGMYVWVYTQYFLPRQDSENSMAVALLYVEVDRQTDNLMSRTAPSSRNTGWARREIQTNNFKFSTSYIFLSVKLTLTIHFK